MISFFKSLPKHIKTAFLSIFRHLAMSLSASSAVTVTLILFAAFLLIAGNVGQFTDNIADDLSIHVQLNKNYTKDEDISKMKKELETISGVKKATFSDKDAELEFYIKEMGEEFAMYRGKENPLFPAYYVSVKDADRIKAITEEISKKDFVKEAVYGGTSVSDMVKLLDKVRTGGMIFVILLTALAIFLISNSIKMTIYARNNEISIMRNVGAANWYIKVPFMIEGMLIGLIGAIIPCLVAYFGYSYLYDMANGQIVTSMFALLPVHPFALQVCGALLLGGMGVGFIGSFFSTTKYLHWKR